MTHFALRAAARRGLVWVVASAVTGGADVLVTGDAAVLKLGKRAPLPIVSLAAFGTGRVLRHLKAAIGQFH